MDHSKPPGPHDDRPRGEGRYREWVVGPPRHSGTVVAAEDIPDKTRAAYGKPIFLSYWTVPDEGSAHIEDQGSLTGYDGPLYLSKIVVDIDAPDLKGAQALMLEATRHLKSKGVPDRAIRVWFSGGKGYHLHLPPRLLGADGEVAPTAVEAGLRCLFGEMGSAGEKDGPSVDLSMVRPKHPTGLIRAKWSRHEDTGRYKVPIRADERSARPEDHAAWASAPVEHRMDVQHTPCKADISVLSDVLPESRGRASKSGPINVRTERFLEVGDDPPAPSNITCMWHLYRRGPVEGRRHDDMLRLAAAHAKRGASKPEIEALLKQWWHAPDRGHPLDEEGRQHAKDMALRATGQHPNGDGQRWDRFRCDDEVMSEFCDSQCVFYEHKRQQDPVLSDEGEMDVLLKGLEMDLSDGVDVGRAVGASESCTIVPEEVATLIGKTGIGKSAFLQHVALAHEDLSVLHIDGEDPAWLKMRRYLQIKHDLRVDDDENRYNEVAGLLERRGPDTLREWKDEAVGHVSLAPTPPKLKDLERLIRAQQADLVIIDPMGEIKAPKASRVEKPRVITETLLDIAQRLGIIVLTVRHVRKSAEGDVMPDLQAARGVKSVVDLSNHVFGFGGIRGEATRRVQRLKGTRDIDFDVTLKGNPETLRFRAVRPRGGPTGPDGDPGLDGAGLNGNKGNLDKAAVNSISNRQSLPS